MDFLNNETNPINGLKIRNLYTFYIDQINQYYFDSTKNSNSAYYFKFLHKSSNNPLDESDISYNLNVQILNGIKHIMNNTLIKINKVLFKNQSQLFQFINQKTHQLFVSEKAKLNDFNVIGHKNFNRQYIFTININPESYLYEYAEELEFLFYLDEKNQLLSGGFAWNWGEAHDLDDFKVMVDAIFANDCTNYFINQNLEKISLNNIISAFEELVKAPNSSDQKYFLLNKWHQIIQKRYPQQYQQLVAENKLDTWFFSNLIILSTALMIYEDLRKYFQHQDPKKLNYQLNRFYQQKLVVCKNPKFTPKKDWYELVGLIKRSYLQNVNPGKLKNLDDVDEFLDEVWLAEESESFLKPLVSYEFTRDSDQAFMDIKQKIFLDTTNLKTMFLMMVVPNLFGLCEDSVRFITLEQYYQKIAEIRAHTLLADDLSAQVAANVCEWNYDYATFINNQLSFLIVKNKNPIVPTKNGLVESDINHNLYHNYFWAIIYSQSRLWKLWTIENDFNYEKHTKPGKMRQYLFALNNLRYDWNDDFYGMKEIRKIVQRVNAVNDVENGLSQLIKKINRNDHSFGKSKERMNMRYALVAAALFGILDFFTTVFSILPVSQAQSSDIPPINLVFLILGAVLGMMILGSFVVIIYRFYLHKRITMGKK